MGIFGLVLCISSSIFVAQPQIKIFLSALEGTEFQASGTNTHTYLTNSFSEIGLAYKLLIVILMILIFILFVLQILGFKITPISFIVLSLPIFTKFVNDFISFGSRAFTPDDNWDKASIDLYRPVKTITGTFFYYGFLSSIILIIVTALISYVFESNTKSTKGNENSYN